jgi:glycosyltransferase involved in cell wall biosynthesis
MASDRTLHIIKRLDVTGGAERIVTELARTQAAHDVLVYGGGASFYDLGDTTLYRAQGPIMAIWYAFRLRSKYRTFHLHLFPTIYFALFFGRQAIIHEHNTHNKRRDIVLFRPLEWVIYRRARAIIAISPATKSKLVNWIGRASAIQVIPNFVANLPRGNAIDELTEKPHHSRYVLAMVASFTDQKRQELAIKALVDLPPDISLIFAGEGPRLPECRALADALGVNDRITFAGAVKNIADVYQAADLCLLVSHWEGFGLVVLEAASFGVPTVVSDVEGLREVCPDNRFILARATPSGLAEKILEVLPLARSSPVRATFKAHAKSSDIVHFISRLNAVYAK